MVNTPLFSVHFDCKLKIIYSLTEGQVVLHMTSTHMFSHFFPTSVAICRHVHQLIHAAYCICCILYMPKSAVSSQCVLNYFLGVRNLSLAFMFCNCLITFDV